MSSVSLAARRAPAEAKAALFDVRDRLQGYAAAHRALLAPPTANADLLEHLERLCSTIAQVHLAEMGVGLALVAAAPLQTTSETCWRIGLILSELITNALRHGPAIAGDCIIVELRQTDDAVECVVRNSGGVTTTAPPGHGTRILNDLARELGGRIERQFEPRGACVTLSVPLLVISPLSF